MYCQIVLEMSSGLVPSEDTMGEGHALSLSMGSGGLLAVIGILPTLVSALPLFLALNFIWNLCVLCVLLVFSLSKYGSVSKRSMECGVT